MKISSAFTATRILAACALQVAASPILGQGTAPSLQHSHHTVWGEREGLPVGGASRLARTPDGYLWLGSTNGLLRFDGVRFATTDSSEAPALVTRTPGETRPLIVDRRGVLWIGRPDGALVQYENGTFRMVLAPDSTRAPVYRIAEDRLGKLWFVGGQRLYTWVDGRLETPHLPAGVPDTGIMGAVPDTGTGIWIGTESQGIWHVSAQGARRYWNPSTAIDLSVRPLLQDHDGTLWVWGDRLQALRDGRWSRMEIDHVGIPAADMTQAADGSLWIATRGLGVVRLHDGTLEQFTERDGLSDAVVNDLLVDTEGSIWAFTDGGLDRFRAAPFTTVGRGNGLPFDSPLVIQGDPGGGIWAMAAGTGRLYHLDGGIVRRQPGPVVATEVPAPPGDNWFPIGVGSKGGVWIVGRSSGRLNFFKDGRVAGVPAVPADGIRSARHLVEDAQGNSWISFYGPGFGRLNHGRYLPMALPGFDSTPAVAPLGIDGNGDVWAAVDGQPIVFHLRGDSIIGRVDSSTGLREPLMQLAPQGQDTMWGFSALSHLVRITAGRAVTLTVPSIARILAASSAVLVVDQHDLWFASEGGVGRVSLAELNALADGNRTEVAPRFFNALDGLAVGKVTRFNPNPAFRAKDGRIWFATPAGLAVLDPGAGITNPVPPQVHIEEVSVAGRRVPLAGTVSTSPNPDRVEVRYTATGLRVPERVRLQYMLEGVDQDWVDGNAARAATYTQLRPGHYRFRVRAWNEDGVPARSEASIGVQVTPMWYQTWLFRLGLVLAVLGLGAGSLVVLLRARARRKEERIRAAFDAALAERTRLARDLHDTLLQGFTGITLQLQAARHSLTHAPQEADATLARVLDLADTTLRDARLMVWDMRAPELDHQDLPQALENSARISLAGLMIDLDFIVSGAPRRLAPSTETAAFRIGREAVANAVKHASPSRIAIHLAYEDRLLQLSVRDDGPGFEPGAEHAASNDGHWGIKGMRERASTAGGTLQITGAGGEGTTLTLSLPTE